MENKIKIGEKIRLLRKKNDVTQDKLAERLGVTPQAVSRWESGVCYPDMNYLPSIADYFSVSMDELLCYTGAGKAAKVAEYLEEVDRLLDRDKVTDALELLRTAMAEIPSDYSLMLEAAGVLSLYAGKGGFFSNRMVMLICIYCISILPFVYQGIRNNLHGINVRQLLEAAEILGAGKLYAFCRIILPSMLSGILVSSLVSLSTVFGDFTILKIIVGNRYETIQMLLYNSRLIVLQYQCVIVIIMFTATWLLSSLVFKLQNRK